MDEEEERGRDSQLGVDQPSIPNSSSLQASALQKSAELLRLENEIGTAPKEAQYAKPRRWRYMHLHSPAYVHTSISSDGATVTSVGLNMFGLKVRPLGSTGT